MNDAKTVMRTMVEMFATGDVSAASSVVADEYVDYQGDARIEGPDGFRNLVQAVHRSPVRVRIDDLIGEGDTAAARLRWWHTNPDGRVVERETIDLVRCSNGQAIEHWGAEVARH